MPRNRPQSARPHRMSATLAAAIGAMAMGPTACETSPKFDPALAASGSRTDPGRGEDLRLFAAMLNDQSVPTEFRREAAMRLAESGGFEAAEAFRIAWRDGDDRQRDMVVEAIRSSGNAGRLVVGTLLDAMLEGKVQTEDVAQIIVGDSGEQLALVRQRFFRSATLQDWDRYVDLLSRIPLPDAAEILIDGFSETNDESRIAAIDSGLRHWSNTSESRDPDGWRRWWVQLSLAKGNSAALQQLTDRIAMETSNADRASARAVAAEARANQLAIRLAELKTRVMALLDGEARTDALRAMFTDDEPLVRAAGISQVERMLRNAQPIPDVVREDLSGLISDELPANRISAVKILDAIGVEGLGDRLASSLMSETDPAVVAAGLAILGNRPHPTAIPLAIETLGRADPSLTPAAARVVAEVASAGLLHPDDRATIRTLLPEADRVGDRDIARTTVLLAADDGVDGLRDLLRSENESVRLGAAEGFRNRGLREVLREEAADPTVARVAIQAWIESPPDIDLLNLQVLKEVRPDEGTEQSRSDFSTWEGAVVQVLGQLPVDRLAAAERMLVDEPTLLDDRCASLRRGLAAAMLSPEMRLELQDLLIDAMVGADRWTELVAELRTLDAESPDSPLRPRLFEALVETQDWDGAGSLEPTPDAWIALVEEDGGPATRVRGPLIAEIERRFADQIDPDLRARIEAARPAESDETAPDA